MIDKYLILNKYDNDKNCNFILFDREFIYVLFAPRPPLPVPLPPVPDPLPAALGPLPPVPVEELGLVEVACLLSLGAACCLGFLTGFQSSATGVCSALL